MNWLITALFKWINGISAEQWARALDIVVTLAKSKLTSAEKRERAAGELASPEDEGIVPITGSKANFLIELAVQYAKKKGWL